MFVYGACVGARGWMHSHVCTHTQLRQSEAALALRATGQTEKQDSQPWGGRPAGL